MMRASEQWATRPADQRFETLTALRESVNGRRLRSRSLDVDTGKVHVEAISDTEIRVNSVITPANPSHWAFGQLSANIGAPAAYLRTLPAKLLAENLNHSLSVTPRETVKFMTVADADGGPNTLQAVTSPTYGRIWDADCVDAVGRLVERSNGKFFNPRACPVGDYSSNAANAKPSGLYASDRDVFMFMIDGGSLLDAGPRAKLNRGFIVWNSETGAKTFGLMTFLFNQVCGNHIIWGAQNVEKLLIRHTQGGPYRFDTQAAPTLLAYANASAHEDEAAIRKAIAMPLPKDEADLNALAARFKITRGELKSAISFAKSEEGQCQSVWDLVQGLTAYARGFDWLDARTDLEKRAGQILNLVSA